MATVQSLTYIISCDRGVYDLMASHKRSHTVLPYIISCDRGVYDLMASHKRSHLSQDLSPPSVAEPILRREMLSGELNYSNQGDYYSVIIT